MGATATALLHTHPANLTAFCGDFSPSYRPADNLKCEEISSRPERKLHRFLCVRVFAFGVSYRRLYSSVVCGIKLSNLPFSCGQGAVAFVFH